MRPLSLDFRERIVAAFEAGEGNFAELGRRFSVSATVVSKLVRQKRELGTLAPQVHKRGRKPAVSAEKQQELRRHLAEHPDATVVERIEALGLDCTEKTMWQTLRKLGWRFKKVLAGQRAGPPRREATTAGLA
jgi:transposase